MTSTARRLVLLIAMTMGVSLAMAPAVAAHGTSSLPTRIDLPAGFMPEGIESWGEWLYAGSLADGSIYRANARTGEGQILVPGEAGKVAVGLHIDVADSGSRVVPPVRSGSTTPGTATCCRPIRSRPARSSSTIWTSAGTGSSSPTR